MKKLPLKPNGFTIVELLAVMVILSILVTLGFPRFRSFTARQNLNLAQKDLISKLQTAQSRSVDGLKVNNQLTVWGVRFQTEKTYFDIFSCPAEVTNVNLYKWTCTGKTSENIKLPPGVAIAAVSPSATGAVASIIFTSFGTSKALFQSDTGTVILDGLNNPATDVSITLSSSIVTDTRKIKILSSGSIEEVP